MVIKPWKILETRYIHPGIRIDRCEIANGQTLDCQLLEYEDEILVVALTRRQEVVLIRQYRHGVQEAIIELPGGSVDNGESPLDAAKRELLEETGYAGPSFIEVGCISPNPAIYTSKIYSFLALDVEQTARQSAHNAEVLNVMLTPFNEVISMAKNGKLINSLNVSTLFFVLDHLHSIS